MIMFSRLRPPLGLDFERLEPAAVKGHARSVHRAQRDLLRQSQAASFRFRAAALSGCAGAARAAFPSQRFLQLPDLAFRAFYHLFPPNQMVKRIIPGIEGKTPAMTDTQHRSTAAVSIQSDMEVALHRAKRRSARLMTHSSTWPRRRLMLSLPTTPMMRMPSAICRSMINTAQGAVGWASLTATGKRRCSTRPDWSIRELGSLNVSSSGQLRKRCPGA